MLRTMRLVVLSGWLLAVALASCGAGSGAGAFAPRAPTKGEIASPATATPPDVTSQLVLLGDPFAARYPDSQSMAYARNIWDMIDFQVNGSDRIYLGGGNESNIYYPTNAGSSVSPGNGIDVWYYDLASQQFVQDVDSSGNPATLRTEQIDLFHVLPFNNGAEYDLVVPDTDDIGSGEYFFRRSPTSTGWTTTAIAGANSTLIHNRDIFRSSDNLLWAGIIVNQAGYSGIIGTAGDGTGTWNNPSCGSGCAFGTGYKFFTLNGTTYANAFDGSGSTNIVAYSGSNTFTPVPMSQALAMFPNLSINGSTNLCVSPGSGSWSTCPIAYLPMYRPTSFGSSVLYIAADWVTLGDYELQPYPQAVYAASAIGNAWQLSLPGEDPNFTPWDIVVNGGAAYVLGSYPSGTSTVNVVYTSTDLQNWTPVLQFSSDTFARSFVYANNSFYFGMGTWSSPLSTSSGDIYQVQDPRTVSTATPTQTPTATVTQTSIPSATPTQTATATVTESPTNTISAGSPTDTPTITPTRRPTKIRRDTSTPAIAATPTDAPGSTPTMTSTRWPTRTPTETETSSASSTSAAPSSTVLPATDTPTPVSTVLVSVAVTPTVTAATGTPADIFHTYLPVVTSR